MLLTKRARIAFQLTVTIFIIGILMAIVHWGTSRYDAMTSRTIQANNIVDQRLNEFGQQVTTATSNYLTRDELKHSADSTVNTLRKELVGPIKSLERTTRILTTRIEQLAMPVRDTIVIKDGKEMKGYTFNYTSEWVPEMKGLLLGDSVYLDYKLKGGFDLEYHWKKTGIFKPKELSLLITSKDPAVTIDRVQQFHVVAPVPVWKRPGTSAAAGFVAGLVVDGILQRAVFK